jgi:hypothetical protein
MQIIRKILAFHLLYRDSKGRHLLFTRIIPWKQPSVSRLNYACNRKPGAMKIKRRTQQRKSRPVEEKGTAAQEATRTTYGRT